VVHFERKHIAPLMTLLCALVSFTAYFALQRNYEFLLYVGVIVFFTIVIALTNGRLRYPLPIIWGLVLWAVLHMCGGGILVGEGVLYGVMLVPLSNILPILRYDQVVHMVGFGVATLLMFHVMSPLLRTDLERWTALSIVVLMAGLGVGAVNEIVEFLATVLIPETGVGGYLNTALDLVADFAGAILATAYLRVRGFRPWPNE